MPALEAVVSTTRATLSSEWGEHTCSLCQRKFFSRRRSDICRAASCPTARRSLSPRAKPASLADLWQRLRGYFTARGFTPVRPGGIVSPTGETLFMSAALQLLDPVVHNGLPAPAGPVVAAQPVIRLNCTPQVGAEDGFSTSFVNVASEEIVGSVDGYARHLQAWLGAFRRLGLDESRLTLIAEPVRFRGGIHEGNYLLFDYGGVELGEGIYIDTTHTRASLQVLDFGFGLERLLWALNGTPTYYDNFGPVTARIQRRYQLVDAARTTVLIASSGVEPGHRSHGYRLRSSVRRLRAGLAGADPVPLLRHAFDEWSAFIRPPLSLEACVAVVVAELQRQTNLELCRRLGIRPPADVGTEPEAFCQALLGHGIPFTVLLGVGGGSGGGAADDGGNTNEPAVRDGARLDR
jgi:hypothetical protein